MYNRGGRGFENENFRMSRRDNWMYAAGERRGNNGGYGHTRNRRRSRSVHRFPGPQWGQDSPRWMNGRENQNQRGPRSNSCGPERRYYNNQPKFYHNQRYSRNFNQNRNPAPWQDFRQPRSLMGDENIYSSNVSHNDHQKFGQRSMVVVNNVADDMNNSTIQQQNNSRFKSPSDRQDKPQVFKNKDVPVHQNECASPPIQMTPPQKKGDKKAWMINRTVLALIAANVPKDLQQQAKYAFEQINDRVITKITTYHCPYCSIRCRTLQDLESHKTTQEHIKKRDAFLKDWCKTITEKK